MNRAVKGLLIKELKLMKSQMKFFVIILIVWGIIMSTHIDSLFLVGYTAMLCSFLTLTTFSYDEFENSAAYLFTLPIMRKDYIYEKYLFGFLISTLPAIVVCIITWIAQFMQGGENRLAEYLVSLVISLPMAYLLLALEIPLVVKFGQEKSRLISLIMIGSMSVGYAIINHLREMIGAEGTEAV
nr:ABC-2 transporter permease [Lachnospiraceae bacterium]